MSQRTINALNILTERGFTKDHFKMVHHYGRRASLNGHIRHCEGARPFRTGSNNALVRDRLEWIVSELNKRNAAPNVAAAFFDKLATESTQEIPSLKQTTPSSQAPHMGRNVSRHLPVGPCEKEYLSFHIYELSKIARSPSHSMRIWAGKQMSNALWTWTTDALEKHTGVLKHDAIKTDPNFIPSTRNALIALQNKGKIRHEHIVPRSLIVKRINEAELNTGEIHELLEKYCSAVLVTLDEDARLIRANMPHGWCWGDDPYARYHHAGLFDQIVFPESSIS